MATRMQQRRSPSNEWTSINPILAAGEIGFETDTNKFKFGDGVNHWADLVYFSSSDELLNIIDGAPDLLNTLNELAAAIGDDADFFGTVNGNISSAVADHNTDTTNVHGIADTAALATKVYADAAADAAVAATQAYADSLAANYEVAGAAATAKAEAITAAEGYTDTVLAGLVDSAPATLNTLNELAAALGNDANYAATLTSALGDKAPLESPALTGTPTAPTALAGTDTTQVSTTAFVKTAIDAIKTADIEEDTNLYFTDQRAVDAVVSAVENGLDLILDGGTL